MERLGSRLEININRITKLTRGAVMTILVMTAITFGTFSILQAQEPDLISEVFSTSLFHVP